MDLTVAVQFDGSWLIIIIIKPINEEKYSIKPSFCSNMSIVFGLILTALGFLASAILIIFGFISIVAYIPLSA
jgi:hypothetical protein